jgi:hypothetical protein
MFGLSLQRRVVRKTANQFYGIVVNQFYGIVVDYS